jgi:hypothetical protein
MPGRYEYKVVPAPRTPAKVRGVRGDDARFALTVEEAINGSAADGWEFLRSETLPCEHRGWFRRRTDEQTLLVFRRGRGDVLEDVPTMPANVRAPLEPRLAADRAAPRRASFTSLRAAPLPGRDGDRG